MSLRNHETGRPSFRDLGSRDRVLNYTQVKSILTSLTLLIFTGTHGCRSPALRRCSLFHKYVCLIFRSTACIENLDLAVVVAYYSDRFKVRGPFILLFLPITIAGYVLAIAATTNTARYAAVFLIAAGL
jgi:hypothetical protein